MSGQDEKMDIIEQAGREYSTLMELIGRVTEGRDVDELLPKRLAVATAAYAASPNYWKTALEFTRALEKYWRRIKIPTDLVPTLDDIVNTRINIFNEKVRKYGR